MTLPRPSLERRISSALDGSPRRLPVVVGPCGSGKTTLLLALRQQWPEGACQYIDVERSVTTPERFLRAITAETPFLWPEPESAPAGPRAAVDAIAAFFGHARRPNGDPAVFLLDGAFELRTFESFPGLRNAMHELLERLAASRNRFVLTTRYAWRTDRLLRSHAEAYLVVGVPPLTSEEVREEVGTALADPRLSPIDHAFTARVVHALADGRAAYVNALVEGMSAMGGAGASDPVSTLVALMTPGGALAGRCQSSYELRLHTARGYGALKAILEILAEEQPLTLTEVAHRLGRTPGSTKDYLSWLEDVDLVAMGHRRYAFADPLLRLWVKLNCRPTPPSDEDVVREVQVYTLSRLPQAAALPADVSRPAAVVRPLDARRQAGGRVAAK